MWTRVAGLNRCLRNLRHTWYITNDNPESHLDCPDCRSQHGGFCHARDECSDCEALQDALADFLNI